MKLRELIEEKILPKSSDKDDKKFRLMLKLAGKKEREKFLDNINRVRKSEGEMPFTIKGLDFELKTKGKTPRRSKNVVPYRERYKVKEGETYGGKLKPKEYTSDKIREKLRAARDKVNYYNLPPFARDPDSVAASRKKADRKREYKRREKGEHLEKKFNRSLDTGKDFLTSKEKKELDKFKEERREALKNSINRTRKIDGKPEISDKEMKKTFPLKHEKIPKHRNNIPIDVDDEIKVKYDGEEYNAFITRVLSNGVHAELTEKGTKYPYIKYIPFKDIIEIL